MKRRTLLKSTTAVVGFGISASAVASFISGCAIEQGDTWKPEILSKKEGTTLAEVCERIIPRTDTPGAKDALVHRFIDSYIHLNMKPSDVEKFKTGLAAFDDTANKKYKKDFIKLSDPEKDDILNAIADMGGDENIFMAVRSMTIPAFFTSEVGAKEVLKFDQIPGVWEACIPLSDVGGAWAL